MKSKNKKKLSKKAKFLIISAVCIIVIAAGLIILKTALSSKKSEKVFYTANKETYENVIEISGTIAAAQEQTLQALSAGTVTAVYVKKGDRVKKGDIIIQLDDSEQIYNLEKHDYSMATKRLTASERELKLLETERATLEQKVNDRKVIATFDGIIADLKVAVGDSLAAKDKIGTLVNTSKAKDWTESFIHLPGLQWRHGRRLCNRLACNRFSNKPWSNRCKGRP